MATCAAGVCGAACVENYGDCDGNAANGCETDLRSTTANCGRCGVTCGGGQVCAAGVCTTACGAGTVNCAGDCVNTVVDPSNCGGCGRACSLPNVGVSACAASRCMVGGCSAGFADCNGTASDGCEVHVRGTDASNCGACGTACEFANASASCAAGACVLGACAAGFGDCDGVAANGCETNLGTSATSCGTCAHACSAPASATAACVAGSCGLGACSAGFGDCDGNATNGCEVDVGASSTNCGRCGMVCASGLTCLLGVCTDVTGSTPATAGTSCLDLRARGVTTTGAYWVNPGSGALHVWCEMERDGGGYMLVARLRSSGDMAPWDFDLQPGHSAGTYVPDISVDDNFYMNWSAFAYTHFLFSTVDRAVWLVASKSNFDEFYANDQRTVLSSSLSPGPTTYAWYNRSGVPEDPWVSVGDHVGAIVYGEASWPGCDGACGVPHFVTKNTHGGLAVYVR
ncbi:MAG: fibrinogen-like YCDxxxxGGGW domain-containing protein [Deltaproteobacteria bacterium]